MGSLCVGVPARAGGGGGGGADAITAAVSAF